MNIFDKLKNIGDIEIPLSLAVVAVAITVIMVYQPPKKVHIVFVAPKSHQIHSV